MPGATAGRRRRGRNNEACSCARTTHTAARTHEARRPMRGFTVAMWVKLLAQPVLCWSLWDAPSVRSPSRTWIWWNIWKNITVTILLQLFRRGEDVHHILLNFCILLSLLYYFITRIIINEDYYQLLSYNNTADLFLSHNRAPNNMRNTQQHIHIIMRNKKHSKMMRWCDDETYETDAKNGHIYNGGRIWNDCITIFTKDTKGDYTSKKG